MTPAPTAKKPARKGLYIESYGCAMNFSDSEIIASIMAEHGFGLVDSEHEAQVMFINTCAIRENAEQRIRERLKHLRNIKKHQWKVSYWSIGLYGRTVKRTIT